MNKSNFIHVETSLRALQKEHACRDFLNIFEPSLQIKLVGETMLNRYFGVDAFGGKKKRRMSYQIKWSAPFT